MAGSVQEELAAEYGWSLSVINSNPELKKLFAQATKEQWTPDRFVAKVRNTTWFKTHSDTFRQTEILRKADPATYNQRLAQTQSQLVALAWQMGARVPGAQVKSLAAQALQFGWDANQIKQHLAGYIKGSASGLYTGEAGSVVAQFRQLAAEYGVDVSPSTMQKWITSAVKGVDSADTFKNWLTQQAMSRYPSLAERLKAGESVMDIASPYFQTYSQTLEVNPNTIGLKDKLIQNALAGIGEDGKPTTKTLWQFEQDLRNDPRYMKTQQAQDKSMAVGHQILRDFGLIGN